MSKLIKPTLNGYVLLYVHFIVKKPQYCCFIFKNISLLDLSYKHFIFHFILLPCDLSRFIAKSQGAASYLPEKLSVNISLVASIHGAKHSYMHQPRLQRFFAYILGLTEGISPSWIHVRLLLFRTLWTLKMASFSLNKSLLA